MLKELALLFCLLAVAVAQVQLTNGDIPEAIDFPTGNSNPSTNNFGYPNFPLNAGGEHSLPLGDPKAGPFEQQTASAVINSYTTGYGSGLGGAYPGQTFTGVDPVRGILPNLGIGSSGGNGAPNGRSGYGAASGSGFALYQTKYPARTELKIGEYINSAPSSSPVVFLSFVVALAALLF